MSDDLYPVAGQTLTVANGATSFSIASIILDENDVVAGDVLSDGSTFIPIATVNAGLGTGTLRFAWPGTSRSGYATWWIWRNPSKRLSSAYAAQQASRVSARQALISGQSVVWRVTAETNTPWTSPLEGERRLVGTSPTGAWSGRAGLIVERRNGQDVFSAPSVGDVVAISSTSIVKVWGGSSWTIVNGVNSTTIGRFARFTDTGGGMGQSQMSEDGSGNVLVSARVTAGALVAGTVGTAISLPLMIGGNAQFGALGGSGLRYQVVSGTFQLVGINHENNAFNPVALSGTGSDDLLVATSGLVTVRAGLRVAAGNIGVNTPGAANCALDVNGSVAFRQATLTLANGANQNVARPGFSSLLIAGPTGAFSIGGLTGGIDGIGVDLFNPTSQAMTLNNEDGSSTAGNRIVTDTGGNLACKAARLRYDAAAARWRVHSFRT